MINNRKDLTEQHTEKVGYVALSIGLYFLLMPFDLTSLGTLGSFLRILAMVPVGTILLNYRKCTFGCKEAVLIIAYAFYKQLSIIYTVFPTFTLQEAPRIATNIILVLILGSLYYLNTKEVEMLKTALFMSSCLTVLLLLRYADFSGGGRLTIKTASGEIDQNYLIGYFLYIIPFSARKLIDNKRYIYMAAIVAVLMITLMTGSRGGLLAVLVTLFLSVFGELRKKKEVMHRNLLPLVSAGIGGMILLFFLLRFINPDILKRFSPSYVERFGTTGRTSIWKYFFKLFLEASPLRELFGHGAGVSSFLNRMPTSMMGHVAHNLWIDELMTGGVIGLALLLLIHATFLYTAAACRDVFTVSVFFGYLIMCANLSIVSYKPMWNCMILIMLLHKNWKVNRRYGVRKNEYPIQTETDD